MSFFLHQVIVLLQLLLFAVSLLLFVFLFTSSLRFILPLCRFCLLVVWTFCSVGASISFWTLILLFAVCLSVIDLDYTCVCYLKLPRCRFCLLVVWTFCSVSASFSFWTLILSFAVCFSGFDFDYTCVCYLKLPRCRFCLLVVWTCCSVSASVSFWTLFLLFALCISDTDFDYTCVCYSKLPRCRFCLLVVWTFCSVCALVPLWTLIGVCSLSIWVLHSRRSNHIQELPTMLNNFVMAFHGILPKISFLSIRDLFDFDHTCGFPGEGPFWSCLSANVNSVNSHPHCLDWTDDLVCLQEARLSTTNIGPHRTQLLHKGRDFFYAKLLQPVRQKNGIKHIPHGGTACIAPKDLCKNFTCQDDATSLWKDIAGTTRASAVWVQILPRLKVLVFSFYGQATMNGISSHDINNLFLEKLFTIASQFGEIPVLICGDFQDDPDTFPSVQHAKNFDGWSDPISGVNDDGTPTRPITYSRDSNFDTPVDNYSTIDGILMNRVAASALSSVEVLHAEARQHAPIRATFKWDRVFQKGFTLLKPAALDISGLPLVNGKLDHDKIDAHAQKLWQEKYFTKCSQPDDQNAWQSINAFAIQTLCDQGASFKRGPRCRGTAPRFSPHIACPGQDTGGSAITSRSAKLSKLHRLVSELRFRVERQATSTADFEITFKLQCKVAHALQSTKGFEWWCSDVHLHPDCIRLVRQHLQQRIVDLRLKEKRARISAWKNKMIKATRSKQVDKCVYQWISGKTKVSTPNLILNSNGDIIMAPTEAISEINEQWDTIYAANIHHTDPQEVLAKVWPFVKDRYTKIELPCITATDLKNQTARRKVNAAPGLDGWRTVEVQSFPLTVWSAIASYFNQVESGQRCLPQNLTLAKQIILDKGSDDAPLSKRLISLLSVILLSYTGLRYRQLQDWQNKSLPRQLFGGIKHRKMSSVHTQMQLHIDTAHANSVDLVGLKLDKSKCFDRLVPAIVASLFVIFGLPIGLTTFFLQLYQGLKRYMCYKQWVSTRPTTAPNGLIQGCSLSLLAINLQMTVWTLMLEKFSEISVAIFVDDSYLWAKATNTAVLQRAFQITLDWDDMVGQLLNMKKCQIWGTSSKSRADIRELFPQMQLVLTLDVLGATVHTSNAKRFEWPGKKTTKILRDIQLIKAIPCSRAVQEHLISVKVIPQLAFAAYLNGIPKKALSAFQNAIADGLWRGRPMWRSKGLLLSIISEPHRCDPFAARAYNTVVETVDFLKNTDPFHREMWQCQYHRNTVRVNSLIQHFFQATTVLGIDVCGPFHFTMWNATPVSFLDIAKRDLKRILKIAVRDQCYKKSCQTSRKDIFPAVGILDHHATMLANEDCKNVLHNGIPLQCHRDASIVGSCITNDRRFAAGLSETDQCRFCNSVKETFAHLAHDCLSLPFPKRPFCNPSKGPNFGNLGIVETTFEQAQRRLQVSCVSNISVQAWTQESQHVLQHVWTDGSCDETQNFWFTIGGFSVVSSEGTLLAKGPVFHWALSAYSCELWAIIVAFAVSCNPIVCHSDCLSICDQLRQVISLRKVDTSWAHLEWWNYLLHLYTSRCHWAEQPLVIEWCPSHILEHVPIEQISNQQAREFNTTWLNIARNRQADKYAKSAVSSQKLVSDLQKACDKKSVVDWQLWLTNICALVAETSVDREKKTTPWGASKNALKDLDKDTQIFPQDLTILHPTECFANFLPKWDWYLDPQACVWIPSFDTETPLRSYAKITNDQWICALRFFKSLTWVCDDAKKTSFIEIAYHAWFSKWFFPQIDHNPASYSNFLKKVVNQASKIQPEALTPGSVVATCKSFGKTLPAGHIDKATFVIHPKAMKQLAIDLFNGRSHALSSWSCHFGPP